MLVTVGKDIVQSTRVMWYCFCTPRLPPNDKRPVYKDLQRRLLRSIIIKLINNCLRFVLCEVLFSCELVFSFQDPFGYFLTLILWVKVSEMAVSGCSKSLPFHAPRMKGQIQQVTSITYVQVVILVNAKSIVHKHYCIQNYPFFHTPF